MASFARDERVPREYITRFRNYSDVVCVDLFASLNSLVPHCTAIDYARGISRYSHRYSRRNVGSQARTRPTTGEKRAQPSLEYRSKAKISFDARVNGSKHEDDCQTMILCYMLALLHMLLTAAF